MELVQVEVVCPQVFQRLFELLFRAFGVAFARFAGEKYLVAVRFQRGTQDDLRVAVTRRNIEVVDPSLHRLGDDAVRGVLFRVHHDDSGKPDHRKFDARLAIGTFRERCGVSG